MLDNEVEKIVLDDRIEYRVKRTNKLHRIDGPAVEWTDGSYSWWNNGIIHRTDGPAVEHSNGTKYWYINDNMHRTDGPAVECPNGTLEWWIDDVECTFNEYIEKIEFENENDRLVFMMEWS